MQTGEQEVSGVQEDAGREVEEVTAPETARESVQKALQELSADTEVSEKSEIVEHEDESPSKTPEIKPEEKDDVPSPEDFAPARFNQEEKARFEKLPKEAKATIHRMVRDHEAAFTRKNQEISQREKELAGITESIMPHVANWQQAGFTPSQVINQLVGTHQKLTNTETKIPTLKWLLQNCGVTPEQLLEQEASSNNGLPDISQHPQVRALQEQLLGLQNQLQPVQSAYQQQAERVIQETGASIAQEVEKLRNERDSSGKLKWPKLHDPNFLDSVKPLVSEKIRTGLAQSYPEAFMKAYVDMDGIPQWSSNPVGATGLQQNQFKQKAQQAAVSVRGRSAPATVSDTVDPPPEALKNPRATAAWVMANLHRGR